MFFPNETLFLENYKISEDCLFDKKVSLQKGEQSWFREKWERCSVARQYVNTVHGGIVVLYMVESLESCTHNLLFHHSLTQGGQW